MIGGALAATITDMNRTHLRALLVAASTLVATGAYADNPQGKPTGAEKAADKAEKAADKAGDKAEKAAEKAGDKAKDSKDALDTSKAKTTEDRSARKAKEHEAQREKLKATWKGPVSDALRQENEFARRDQAEHGMGPAQQCLGPSRPAVRRFRRGWYTRRS